MCEFSAMPDSPADDIYESKGPGSLPGPSWACSCHTEWFPEVLNRAAGRRFMRIEFFCATCRNAFTRHYDLLEGRYVTPSGRFVSEVIGMASRERDH
jgi:hypothetical protein